MKWDKMGFMFDAWITLFVFRMDRSEGNKKKNNVFDFIWTIWNLLDRFDCNGESSPSIASASHGWHDRLFAVPPNLGSAFEFISLLSQSMCIIPAIQCVADLQCEWSIDLVRFTEFVFSNVCAVCHRIN